MDRNRIRESWDQLSDTYAKSRNPDGNDAALITTCFGDLPPDAVVLDIGCGDGRRTLSNLTHVQSVGLDISRSGLVLAADAVPSARLLQGEMTALPLKSDCVDAITAYHSVFHVPRTEHSNVYREFARVLAPGGGLLMTVGTGRYQTVRSNWLNSGRSMFFSTPGKQQTIEQLKTAGFEVQWERVVDDPLGSSALFVFATVA